MTMRILELGKFYPPHRGGMETLLASWSEGFARRGAEVECVVANHRPKTEHARINGVNVHRYASFGTLASVSLSPGYFLNARRFSADVIHHHFPNPLADLACLSRGRSTPIILTYHSDIIRQNRSLIWYGPAIKKLLALCNCILIATPYHLEYSPWLKPFSEKCRVIPFGINLEKYEPTPVILEKAAALKKTSPGKPILLGIGRLVAYKGFTYLLEAGRQLDASIWIVGTGPLEMELKKQAEISGIKDRVRFWGAVPEEELPAFFHASDIFVLPSITSNEAFGLVQLEAMACGKPVVSTALRSGVLYVNRQEETGLQVPPADGPALGKALQRLMSDRALRTRLGMQAQQRVHKEFAESRMLEQYWGCFEDLVNSHSA